MEYPKLESKKGKIGIRKDPVTKERRNFTIEDEIQKTQSNAKDKKIILQKLRFHDTNEIQLRLGCYILGKLPGMKVKWKWNQNATFIPILDFKSIYKEAAEKEWFK